MERLRTAVINQVRRDPFLGSKEVAFVQIFKNASCTTSSERPGSPRTRMATAYASPAYRSYSSNSASWLPAARTTASSASGRPSVAIGSRTFQHAQFGFNVRPACRQLANGRLLRRRDRPFLVVDEPPRPLRVLPPALACCVQRLRHELYPGQAGQLADLLVQRQQILFALLVVEQVQRERVDLLLRLHALADRHPEPIAHPPLNTLRLFVSRQPLLGRVEVEGVVPALVCHDPAELVFENRVA